MKWFKTQRQEWIAQMLAAYGYINRQHLMRNFGVSSSQAALDFRQFNKANPTAMKYCDKNRTYVANVQPKKCG